MCTVYTISYKIKIRPILPHIMEMSSSRPLFQKLQSFYVNRDLIYTHPTDQNHITLITNPYNVFIFWAENDFD